MILSDRTIREELAAGRIVIDPLDEACIQPSSVDLRLDRYFRVFLNHTTPVIDVKKPLDDLTRLVELDEDDPFILHPGEFVLGSTAEVVGLPDDLVARIEGKAHRARYRDPDSLRLDHDGSSCEWATKCSATMDSPCRSSRPPIRWTGVRAARSCSPMAR